MSDYFEKLKCDIVLLQEIQIPNITLFSISKHSYSNSFASPAYGNNGAAVVFHKASNLTTADHKLDIEVRRVWGKVEVANLQFIG